MLSKYDITVEELLINIREFDKEDNSLNEMELLVQFLLKYENISVEEIINTAIKLNDDYIDISELEFDTLDKEEMMESLDDDIKYDNIDAVEYIKHLIITKPYAVNDVSDEIKFWQNQGRI